MKTHFIFPMGGAGSRFSEVGIDTPKPLIDIQGKPFFYWAVESLAKNATKYDLTFVVLQEHISNCSIDQKLLEFYTEADIITIEKILPGPVFTCLEGVKDIEDDWPVIFNDCDHLFSCKDLEQRLEKDLLNPSYGGSLLSFESDQPQYSYIEFDKDGNIIGTREKNVVSNWAICGAYIFRNVSQFRMAANRYMANCPYSECFMSGVYNEMINTGETVTMYPLDYHVEFGTPKEYEEAKGSVHFKEWER